MAMDTDLTREQVAEVMAALGMSSDEAESYRGLVTGMLAGVAAVEELPATAPPPAEREPRAWTRPGPEDNPLGAWYVRTDIRGSGQGRLAGRSVALKDTVLLADVPLMGGTSILDGYVADTDAEIVRRMLAEGATITGKTVCEAYCFSGGSHTAATGPVRNPHDPTRSAGGSSSGSGALVAAGEVDLAIGCDQGGSVRMPASFCGIVGMKPTFGLVPYTGILGMSPNIDHTGPMTADVADNALLLEVLAGPDGVDSRQSGRAPDAYTQALGQGANGLRVGIVAEGFGTPASEPGVDAQVHAAAKQLESLGARVSEVSIPMHARTASLTFAGLQSMFASMFFADGCLLERPDLVPESYVEYQHRWRERADELPANVKTGLIFSEVMRRRFGFKYVARAAHRLGEVRAAYDAALREVDALLMPTTPMTATPLPPQDAGPEVVLAAAFAPTVNTSPFNYTHHPALSIPCGTRNGLPVGMMLVGRHYDESLLYRLAHAYEQSQRG